MKNQETLDAAYPNLMSRIEEEIDELRYLVVVDPNEYDAEIDDAFDDFEPQDYNFVLYLTERLQKAIGPEMLERLPQLIEEAGLFSAFLASEEDLYGVWCEGDEEEVASRVLALIESHLSEEQNNA